MANATALLAPLRSGNETDRAADQIARTIEQDIFGGRLPPGEKLREEELAERFGASAITSAKRSSACFGSKSSLRSATRARRCGALAATS